MPCAFTRMPSEAAHENGFVQNEGIACELAAIFYLNRGFERIGISYIRAARNCYLRWGALGKVKQLDELYPDREELEPERPPPKIGAPVNQFDFVDRSQRVAGGFRCDCPGEANRYPHGDHGRARRR